MEHLGEHLGKSMFFAGIAIAALGVVLGKIPFLEKLPGDIVIHKKNFSFFFPLATNLILSVRLSIILYLTGRKCRKCQI
nr:DUF2905 domain-containing protein [Candidatus Magnetominusculus xianensis]